MWKYRNKIPWKEKSIEYKRILWVVVLIYLVMKKRSVKERYAGYSEMVSSISLRGDEVKRKRRLC
jgi:hypothetical protein